MKKYKVNVNGTVASVSVTKGATVESGSLLCVIG